MHYKKGGGIIIYGDIYCIEDMKMNKVVYVGQTIEFEKRKIEKKFGLSVESLNNRCEFYGLPSSLSEIREMPDEEWDAI